jgi:hypothetical protein
VSTDLRDVPARLPVPLPPLPRVGTFTEGPLAAEVVLDRDRIVIKGLRFLRPFHF